MLTSTSQSLASGSRKAVRVAALITPASALFAHVHATQVAPLLPTHGCMFATQAISQDDRSKATTVSEIPSPASSNPHRTTSNDPSSVHMEVDSALEATMLQLRAESRGKALLEDEMFRRELYVRSVRNAQSAGLVIALVKDYVSDVALRPPPSQDGANLPSAKPLAIAVTRLGELRALPDALSLVHGVWGIGQGGRKAASATSSGGEPVGTAGGRAGAGAGAGRLARLLPALDVHSSVLTALLVELSRPGAMKPGWGKGRSDTAAALVDWAIQHVQLGRQRSSSPSTSSMQAEGFMPVSVINAALRVWAVHGCPSAHLTDMLGWRVAAEDGGGAGLGHARVLANEEAALRFGKGDGFASATPPVPSVAEMAYLWQARGGLWMQQRGHVHLEHRVGRGHVGGGKRRPAKEGESGGEVSAADMLAPHVKTRPLEPAFIPSSSIQSRIDNATRRAVIYSDSQRSAATGSDTCLPSVEESSLRLGPVGYSPLVDLPLGCTHSLRLATAMLREATGCLITFSGVLSPLHGRGTHNDARPNAETIAACFAMVGNPTDILAVGSIAVYLGIRLTSCPGLSIGVTRSVQMGALAEAHALLELAQAQDNEATRESVARSMRAVDEEGSFGTSVAGTPSAVAEETNPTLLLRAIPPEMRDFNAWAAQVGSRQVGLVQQLAVAGAAAGTPLPVLRRMQALVAQTGALPLMLPSLSSTPSQGMSEAYNAIVRSASGSGAHVQAMAGWDTLVQSGAAVTLPTLRAVLRSCTELGLPLDVYRTAEFLESSAMAHFALQAPLLDRKAAAVVSALSCAPVCTGAVQEFERLARAFITAHGLATAPGEAGREGKTRLRDLNKACTAAAKADGKVAAADHPDPWAVCPIPGALAPSSVQWVDHVDRSSLVAAALDALAGIGDGDAVAAVSVRELRRLTSELVSSRPDRPSPHYSPTAIRSIARASVRGLAVCGELRMALAAARAFMTAGAHFEEGDLLTIVLSVMGTEDTEVAFAALELGAQSGVYPGPDTESALALMTSTLVRRAHPIPDALASAASSSAGGSHWPAHDDENNSHTSFLVPVEDGGGAVTTLSGGESTFLLSSLSALADTGLASSIQDELAGKGTPGGADGGALAVGEGEGHPLAEAAHTARVMSTAIIRWTMQQLQLVAMQHRELAQREGSGGGGEGTHEQGVGVAQAGMEAQEDVPEGDGGLLFLGAAREMLLLTVDQWPVSARVASARADLDIASIRRARVSRVHAEHAAKLSAPAPADRPDGSDWLPYGELLRRSASWEEFVTAVRADRLPPPADLAYRTGRLQTLPAYAWGPPHYWRVEERDINPDEDGSGVRGSHPVFGRSRRAGSGVGADGRVAKPDQEARDLSYKLARQVLDPVVRGSPPLPADARLLSLLRTAGGAWADRFDTDRVSAPPSDWPAADGAELADVRDEGAARMLARAFGGYVRGLTPGGRQRRVASVALALRRAARDEEAGVYPGSAMGKSASGQEGTGLWGNSGAVARLRELKDRLSSAVRAGLRGSAVLNDLPPTPSHVGSGRDESVAEVAAAMARITARAQCIQRIRVLADIRLLEYWAVYPERDVSAELLAGETRLGAVRRIEQKRAAFQAEVVDKGKPTAEEKARFPYLGEDDLRLVLRRSRLERLKRLNMDGTYRALSFPTLLGKYLHKCRKQRGSAYYAKGWARDSASHKLGHDNVYQGKLVAQKRQQLLK